MVGESASGPHIVLFVEGADQAAQAERLVRSENAKVIALDPASEYALERSKVAHSIPDEYCSEEHLNEVGIGNFEKVERFCDHADQWLSDHCEPVKTYGLRPARYNYFALKRLFDAMTVRLALLEAILQKERPEEVWYFSDAEGGGFDHNLFFEESIYLKLIPLACCSLQIDSKKLDRPISRPNHCKGTLSRSVPWARWWRVVRTLVDRPVVFAGSCLKRWRETEAPAVLIDDLGADDILLVASQLVKHTEWRLLNWRPGRDQVIGLCPPAISQVGCKAEREAVLTGLRIKVEELWRGLSQDEAFRSYLVWGKVKFGNVLESRLRYVFTTLLVEIVARYMSARTVIGRFRPVLVLFSQIVHYWQHALAAAAREEGIPVVGYQHGALGERFAPILYYIDCREPDYLLLYGEGVQRFMERNYPQAAMAIPVGSPRLDRLSQSQPAGKRTALCRRWGLNPERRIVVYCPTFVYGNQLYVSYCYPRSDSYYFKVQRRIVEVFREFPSVLLVVKEHHETSGSFPLRKCIQEQGFTNCLFFKNEASFGELLPLADTFILDSPTTTFLEILTTNKPVFVLNNWFRWNEDALALVKERAEFSQDIDDFVALLRMHLRRDWTVRGESISDAFLKRFGTHLGDGQSAERAASALRNIYRRHNRRCVAVS